MAEKTDHALVQIVRDGEDTGLDLPEECGHVFVIEGESSTQQGVEDHTTGPDIHLRPCIQLPGNNL